MCKDYQNKLGPLEIIVKRNEGSEDIEEKLDLNTYTLFSTEKEAWRTISVCWWSLFDMTQNLSRLIERSNLILKSGYFYCIYGLPISFMFVHNQMSNEVR